LLEAVVEVRVWHLQEHSRELEVANRRLVEADRMKSRFLARMSHELRTPLNSIIGFSELLITRFETLSPDRAVSFLRNISSSGNHLLNLINTILDLSKIEAGRMEVNLQQVLVAEAVDNARRVMQGVAQERGIEISVEAPPAGRRVWTDATKLRQILLNLLSNAVKFSPDAGTVELTARTLGALHSPLGVDSLELTVSDHGPGIADEDLPRVFEEFRQLGRGNGSSEVGTGLGLTLTKRLVELQGGSISVSSVVGAGTTFRVVLPMSPCDGCRVRS
jgi:signal transduction histidine kinase